jgi:hydroxymethylpyrimidine pyrophosphatase-like HAD family hydrolase
MEYREMRLKMAAKNGHATQAIRMVIADVDGTLVTQEKILTKRAADAVLRLHEAGIEFSITSGRPPRGMAMLIDPLKLTQPLAAFNGGVLIEPDLSTVVDQKFLPAGVPETVIEVIENRSRCVGVHGHRMVRARCERGARCSRAVDGEISSRRSEDLCRTPRSCGEDCRH